MRRVLLVYLVLYYLLVAAAVVTLWRSGLIDDLSRPWTYASIALALALGALLWATSRTTGEPSSGDTSSDDPR